MQADNPLKVTIRRPSKDPAFEFESVFTRKVNELARRTAEMMADEVRHQITSKNLVATGKLLRSVTASVEDSATGKLAKVSSDQLQARIMETGSRPQRGSVFGSRWAEGNATHAKNSPFMGRIMLWMTKKGISGGRKVAFRIARNIALKGIPSSYAYPLRHPFTNAQRNVRRKVNRLWQAELDNAMVRLNARK